MIMVKRIIIYWLPRGNQAVFHAQWSVRRVETSEVPEATRRFIQLSAQAASPANSLLVFLEHQCILMLYNAL